MIFSKNFMHTKPKLVILSGAGISAESGLATFRDNGGLWNNYSVYDVATPEAFERDPELVLNFYNFRRQEVLKAEPNAGHFAIAKAEEHFDVTVLTQNVDDLHERAGSSHVLHVHGLITQARSHISEELFELNGNDIQLGDLCPQGEQLRPHVVWFGEIPYHMDEAPSLVEQADIVIVVGTSLNVYPFAGLTDCVSQNAKCYLVTKDIDAVPYRFEYIKGNAAEHLPQLLESLSESC